MPTYYTVAQYVPDPVTGERINIGVIAFGDGQIRSQFVTDWRRVARFGRRQDVDFAKEFAKRVHGAAIASAAGVNQPSLLGGAGHITEQSLLKMIGESSNLIQFTPAQVAIGSPDDLIPSLAQLFLRTPNPEPRAFRDRQQAATFAVRTIREVVQRRVGAEEAKRALRVNYEVAGKLVKHLTVDLGIVNARVYEVAQAISFETHDMTELDRRRNEVDLRPR